MRLARGTALVAAVAAVAVMVVGCSGDDDDASGDDAAGSTTTMATGGIEIAAPEGWSEIPMPVLGFGVALPPGWEAVRLDEQGLSSAAQADPVVPGFAAAAHSAAELGGMFYAAGVDRSGQVVDLTVEAFDGAEVAEGVSIESLARELADGRGWTDPMFEVVEGAELPTVDVHFTAQASRATPAPDDPADQMETVPVEGVERLVLSPAGVVYSFSLTSPDAAAYGDLASGIFSSVAFAD